MANEEAQEVVEMQRLTHESNTTYKCLSCRRYFAGFSQLADHPCDYYQMQLTDVNSDPLVDVPIESHICRSCSQEPTNENESDICHECKDLYVYQVIKPHRRHTKFVRHTYICNTCRKLFTKTCDIGDYLPKSCLQRCTSSSAFALVVVGFIMFSGSAMFTIGFICGKLNSLFS